MSFDWQDYLTLAKALANDPDNPGPIEACLRSAISRAYYSAFMLCSQLAKTEDLTIPRGGGSHQAVIDHFLDADVSPSRKARLQIGNELGRLRARRVIADYDDVLPYSNHAAGAQAAISMAENIIKTLMGL